MFWAAASGRSPATGEQLDRSVRRGRPPRRSPGAGLARLSRTVPYDTSTAACALTSGANTRRARVPLLPRGVQVIGQPPVDHRSVFGQPVRHPHRCLPRRRQRLPHRPAVHRMAIGQLPDRQLLHPRIPTDRSEQLHPRLHPEPLQGVQRRHRSVSPSTGATSNRHNEPGVSRRGQIKPSQQSVSQAQVEPLQAVTPGPSQQARLSGPPKVPRCWWLGLSLAPLSSGEGLDLDRKVGS